MGASACSSLIGMVLALDLESITGWACCGGASLVVLVIVGAVSGSKKKKKGKTNKPSRLERWEESDKQNQRIIEQAYRQFDRLSADEIRALGKHLGPDLIG